MAANKILGPPGLGKSTAAQLLGKKHGFVYYEGDCFMFAKNPFIPINASEPSMAQAHQKPLKGEGMLERKRTLARAMTEAQYFLKGEKFDEACIYDWIDKMVKDLKTQRARIGGNWAVASVMHTRKWRDFARYRGETLF